MPQCGMKTLIILLLSSMIFLGCEAKHPLEPLPDQIDSILIPVEFAYDADNTPFPGGWCEEVCLVMLANWYHQSHPSPDEVRTAQAFLSSSDTRLYFLHLWQMQVEFVRWRLPLIYKELQRGKPMLAIIDGWENMLHAIVIMGMDSEYVYYHDPTLGPYKKMTHEQFRQLHKVGHYGIWRIQ